MLSISLEALCHSNCNITLENSIISEYVQANGLLYNSIIILTSSLFTMVFFVRSPVCISGTVDLKDQGLIPSKVDFQKWCLLFF